MKMFQIPINDERIQTLTQEQIDFMIYSEIADDPEKLSKLENSFYDPDFDEEFDNIDKDKSSEKMKELGFTFNYSNNTSGVTSNGLEDHDSFFDEEDDEFLGV